MTCAKCGAAFDRVPGARGRPRVHCDVCRQSKHYQPVAHPERACRQCGHIFRPRISTKVFCSKRCSDKGKPSASGLSCRVCGEPMIKGRASAAGGKAQHNRCAPLHGASGYRRGCRCEICRAGVAAKMRAYAQRRLEEGRPLLREHWISDEDRRAIYDRDAGMCQLCAAPVDFDAHYLSRSSPTLDHILPRSLGGDDSPDNLRLACRQCNAARGNRLDWEAHHVSLRSN